MKNVTSRATSRHPLALRGIPSRLRRIPCGMPMAYRRQSLSIKGAAPQLEFGTHPLHYHSPSLPVSKKGRSGLSLMRKPPRRAFNCWLDRPSGRIGDAVSRGFLTWSNNRLQSGHKAERADCGFIVGEDRLWVAVASKLAWLPEAHQWKRKAWPDRGSLRQSHQ